MFVRVLMFVCHSDLAIESVVKYVYLSVRLWADNEHIYSGKQVWSQYLILPWCHVALRPLCPPQPISTERESFTHADKLNYPSASSLESVLLLSCCLFRGVTRSAGHIERDWGNDVCVCVYENTRVMRVYTKLSILSSLGIKNVNLGCALVVVLT